MSAETVLIEMLGSHGRVQTRERVTLAAGVPVKTVSGRLGHGSAAMTLDVYGHLWPGEEDRVRDAIGRLFRPDELRGAQG